MAQAITTKYAGPTDTRGSRVIVKSWNGRTTYSWDSAKDVQANHEAAICEHVAMLNEKAKEYHDGFKVVSPLGSNPDGTGYTVIIM